MKVDQECTYTMKHFIYNNSEICVTDLNIFHLCSVVVVFADKFMTQKLMDAAGRHGITGRFIWILCDAWNAAPTHRGIDIAFRRPMTGNGKTAYQTNSHTFNISLLFILSLSYL